MTKKKDNKKKPQQFPNNYRFITESKYYKNIVNYYFRLSNKPKVPHFFKWTSIVLVIATVAVLVFGILIFSINFYKNYQDFKQTNYQRQSIQSKINFWKSISQKYEGYKDAYFRIALLEYNLGNFDKARENNKKALLLDPNFSDAKKLEEVLNRSN